MTTKYLVHRPVMDYEESLIPYFICDTWEIADERIREIRLFCKDIWDQLPDPYDQCEEYSEEEWDKWYDLKQKLGDIKYPYNLLLKYDFNHFQSGQFIDMIELPYHE